MRPRSFYFERAIKEAKYLLENECTTREAAKALGVSRGTIQQDLKNILPLVDKELFDKVQEQLKKNISTSQQVNIKPRVTVQCECTNCKYNNAISKSAVGYCTKSHIVKYKEFDLANGDSTDVGDCEAYLFEYKGKEFLNDRVEEEQSN